MENSHDSEWMKAIGHGAVEELGTQEFARFEASPLNRVATGDGLAYLCGLNDWLREVYGSVEAEGIALCVGRCAYPFIKKAFESVLGFQELDFRLLQTPKRTAAALARMTDTVLAPAGIQLERADDAAHFRWLADAGSGEGFPAEIIGGLLQETLLDISGGRFYPVARPEQLADGKLLIAVSKTPLGH